MDHRQEVAEIIFGGHASFSKYMIEEGLRNEVHLDVCDIYDVAEAVAVSDELTWIPLIKSDKLTYIATLSSLFEAKIVPTGDQSIIIQKLLDVRSKRSTLAKIDAMLFVLAVIALGKGKALALV